MGTPLDSREQQVVEVVDRLEAQYPDAEISLHFEDRWQLLVAVVLSAQCTDERVNKVTSDLFEKYDGVEDFAALTQDELAAEIDSITYYNNKAGYLTEAARLVLENHDGEVPDTMSDLTDLPGVGRKTANVILQHGHEVVEGIVVDTHVQRLTRRLGITEEQRPEAIETDLMGIVREEHWQRLTHLLISHGRATCTARTPDCSDCVLEDVCPSSKVDAAVDLASGEAW